MQAVLLRFEAECQGRRTAWTVGKTVLSRLAEKIGLHRRVPPVGQRFLDHFTKAAASREVYRSIGAGSDARDAVLLVSHDLSRSGAPKILLEMTVALTDGGYRVVVLAPSHGPLSTAFIEAGATVVLDSKAFESGNSTLSMLGAASVAAFCNTLVTCAAVRMLSPVVPTFWYLHEVSLIETLTRTGQVTGDDFRRPFQLWCGSEQSATLVRAWRPDVRVVAYGLAALRKPSDAPPADHGRDPVRFAIFGSFEMRKGQDLAIEAVRLLDPRDRAALHLILFGRPLIPAFDAQIREAAHDLPVTFGGELDVDAYRTAMLETDVVLVSSRDDTLPLVSLDALGAHCILACTPTTGTAAYLQDGIDGFVAQAATAEALAELFVRVLAARAAWPSIRARGARVFEREFAKERFAGVVTDAVRQATTSSRASAR